MRRSALLFLALATRLSAQTDFVRESAVEFLAQGRTLDGRTQLFSVDRGSGVLRRAVMDATGSLTWSAAAPTGVVNVSGAGLWQAATPQGGRLVLTSPDHNRLESPATEDAAAQSHSVSPTLGPLVIAGLRQTTAASPAFVVGSTSNDAPTPHRLAVSPASGGAAGAMLSPAAAPQGANSAILKTGQVPRAVFVFDGSLRVYNAAVTGITAATACTVPSDAITWSYGWFKASESRAQFLYAEPGESTLRVRQVTEPTAGTFSFAAESGHGLAGGIRQIVAVPAGATNRLGILFTDGSAALYQFDGVNAPVLLVDYGVAPEGAFLLGATDPAGRFILLSGSDGHSARARVFDAAAAIPDDTPLSSTALPPLQPRATAENVWVFAGEPFANPLAAAVYGRRFGEWAASDDAVPRSLAAPVSVQPFVFADESTGLTTAALTTLSDPVPGRFALPSQFLPDAGVISFTPLAMAARPTVSFAPAPGFYLPLPPADGERAGSVAAVSLVLTSSTPGTIRYRLSSAGPWSIWPPRDLTDPLNPVPLPALAIDSTTTVEAFLELPGQNSAIIRGTYTIGTPDPLSIPAAVDSDLNGLADAWELTFGQTDPNADPDNDGRNNLTEQNAGTDPLDSGHSVPNPPLETINLTMTRENGSLTISWPADAGPVILESSPDMADWSPVLPQPPANTWTAVITSQRRFFRLTRP